MKTPNDAVKMGGYITIPPVKEKRWDVISGYIKLFNFQIGAELGVADAVNYTNLMRINPLLRLYGIDSYEVEGNELERYEGGLYAEGQENRKINAEKLQSIGCCKEPQLLNAIDWLANGPQMAKSMFFLIICFPASRSRNASIAFVALPSYQIHASLLKTVV